jgi:hypothetical protein
VANFDLNSYETVEQRHDRVIQAYPDLRVVMLNHSTTEDRAKGVWVVECRVYLNAEDQANNLPKATEWAFEIDGQGMANKTSALENACTSALGRALRWAVGGSKGPSRQEMEKVARATEPARDWLAEAKDAEWNKDIPRIRGIYADAVKAKADLAILEQVKAIGAKLSKS